MDQELRPRPQSPVGDRVHVADDHIGLVARLEERVGATVDADENRLEVADVRLDDPQIALVTGAARDDERVAVAKPRLDRREVDPLGEDPPLLAEIAHRVLGKRLERFGHAPALLGERVGELLRLEDLPRGHAIAVPEDACAADGHELAVGDRVEELRARAHRSGERLHERATAGPDSGSGPSATATR